MLDESQSVLLELKAKVDSLEAFRKKLEAMRARYVGAFRQVDTYFEVPKGRLKLREMGTRESELIYYEREDRAEPKRSKVFIIKLQESDILKKYLEIVLRKRVVVDKKREIYRYHETQIHLDTVEYLGTFIEFERKTDMTPLEENKNRKALKDLMKILGIGASDLVKGSYSDLLNVSQKY